MIPKVILKLQYCTIYWRFRYSYDSQGNTKVIFLYSKIVIILILQYCAIYWRLGTAMIPKVMLKLQYCTIYWRFYSSYDTQGDTKVIFLYNVVEV